MITFDSALDCNYIQLPTLKDVEKYDIAESEKELKKIIKQFIDVQIDYGKITPPRITRNYELEYIKPSSKVDNVGNFVVTKVTSEEEARKFYDAFYIGLSKLNKDEIIYFSEVLYSGKKDNVLYTKLYTTQHLLKPIKDSCIVKLSRFFKVAVKKKNK